MRRTTDRDGNTIDVSLRERVRYRFDNVLARGTTAALAAAGYTPEQVDIVVITHMHGDHVGDRHIATAGSGSCAQPEMTQSALPTISIPLTARANRSMARNR